MLKTKIFYVCNKIKLSTLSFQPSVAIVILNWNGKKFLEQFLPSVVNSVYKNLQIIIADNASTDDSIDFVKCTYPFITIINNEENYGFAKGYNIALKKVIADYYILLNSDIEVTPGWIEPVIFLMESDPAIVACQPKMLSYTDRSSFEYAGGCGGWLDAYGYPFCRGRVFEVCEKDAGQYDDVQQIFWASGAALFIKAATFREAGGFDEYFFAHQEEIDLCWRLQLMGYKIFVQPLSVVYHVGGGTLPMGNSRKVYLNFRNNLIMLAKNLSSSESFWKIPFRMSLDILAAYKNLFAGEGAAFYAIAKAHWHFYKWLVSTKIKPFKSKGLRHPVSGMWSGLIIWDYYIKKKKTFSEVVGNKK